MLKKFRKNNTAASALEFALIAPVLFILIFAILEITSVMLATAVMENAVRTASRMGITGYTPVGVTRDTYIQQLVKDNMLYLNPNSVVFSTLVYDSFANIGKPEPYTDSNGNTIYNIGEPYTDINGNGQWDPDMGASGAGGAGAIVVYEVQYPWQIITPLLSRFFPTNGQNLESNGVIICHGY